MRVRADFLPSGDGGGTGAGVGATTGGVGVVGFAVGVISFGVVGIDGVVCGATHWMNYIVNQLLSN